MRSSRRTILSAAALVAVTAVVLTTQSALSARAGTPTCGGSQLSGKFLDSNGAAGTILFSVTLQNRGAACTLKGYPALGVANGSGMLPSHTVKGGLPFKTAAPKRVSLAHLARASVLISFEDVPVGNEKNCPFGTALLLRTPGAWQWLTINKVSTDACGGGTLHTSPVLAGVQGSQ